MPHKKQSPPTPTNMSLALNTRTPAAYAMARAATLGMNPWARIAFKGGIAAWRARKQIQRGRRWVRTGKRAYTAFSKMPRMRAAKRQRFSRMNVGHSVGSGTSKKFERVNTNGQNLQSRVLYDTNLLTNLVKGDALNERERNIINLRGFKICQEVTNQSTQKALYYNVAVICPRTSQGSISNTDFFRSQGSGTARGTNFDTGLTSNEFHCLPINTDNYTVLKHRRYRLGPATQSSGVIGGSQNNYMNIDWYIPIKRQIRYESGIGNPTDGNIYIVYWADRFDTNAGTLAQANAFRLQERYVTYFKEPKP